MSRKYNYANKTYWLVSFGYEGIKANDPDASEDACKVLNDADEIICDILDRKFFNYCHAYSWCDGSLYKYFCTKLDCYKFERKLRHAIDNQKTVWVSKIDSVDLDDVYEIEQRFNGCV